MSSMFQVRCVLLPLLCIPACILATPTLSVFCLLSCVSVCVTFKHPLAYVVPSIGTSNGVPSITHLSRNVLCVGGQCIRPAHWRLEHQPGDGHGLPCSMYVVFCCLCCVFLHDILATAALSVFCLPPCVSVCVTFKHPLIFVIHWIGTCNGVPSITHLSRNVLCVGCQCIRPAHWRLEHWPGDEHVRNVQCTLCSAAPVVISRMYCSSCTYPWS
jgi:hypothetical protein